MTDTRQNDNESIAARLSRTEAQLQHIKIVLWVIGAIFLCSLIPPLGTVVGFVIAIILIVVAVLAYMYGVIWVLERCFGNKSNANKPPE